MKTVEFTGYGKLICGDALDVLRGMESGSVDAVITSPPYWGGLRDYGSESQLGIEPTPEDYVNRIADIGGEIFRVTTIDASFWLNLGDTFAASGKGGGGLAGNRGSWKTIRERKGFRSPPPGFKFKDITLTPFRVAERLRCEGWYLRQVIVWSKPSATEPKRIDRPSCSHEYLFLLAKGERYSVKDPGEYWWGESVWKIQPASDMEHPATMPSELARRCVVSSSGVVFDPFCGSGTTCKVAAQQGRKFIGVELDEKYFDIACKRVEHCIRPGMFANV